MSTVSTVWCDTDEEGAPELKRSAGGAAVKAKVRYRPARSPYGPGRPWEARCLDPRCSADTHAHTWHLNWYHAMGRVGAHRREKHT